MSNTAPTFEKALANYKAVAEKEFRSMPILIAVRYLMRIAKEYGCSCDLAADAVHITMPFRAKNYIKEAIKADLHSMGMLAYALHLGPTDDRLSYSVDSQVFSIELPNLQTVRIIPLEPLDRED